jgi:hypothetical protein
MKQKRRQVSPAVAFIYYAIAFPLGKWLVDILGHEAQHWPYYITDGLVFGIVMVSIEKYRRRKII